MKTLMMNLTGCFLIVAGVFTMSGCSQTALPNVALSEEPQEEAVEGAKAIFATGE